MACAQPGVPPRSHAAATLVLLPLAAGVCCPPARQAAVVSPVATSQTPLTDTRRPATVPSVGMDLIGDYGSDSDDAPQPQAPGPASGAACEAPQQSAGVQIKLPDAASLFAASSATHTVLQGAASGAGGCVLVRGERGLLADGVAARPSSAAASHDTGQDRSRKRQAAGVLLRPELPKGARAAHERGLGPSLIAPCACLCRQSNAAERLVCTPVARAA
jgi:hypothetical protein